MVYPANHSLGACWEIFPRQFEKLKFLAKTNMLTWVRAENYYFFFGLIWGDQMKVSAYWA